MTKRSTRKPSQRPPQRRKFVRFDPDEGTVALIDLRPPSRARFAPNFTALVIDEAHGGCSFVCRTRTDVQIGQEVRVKVGHLDPMIAEIRWLIQPDLRIQMIGIKFKE